MRTQFATVLALGASAAVAAPLSVISRAAVTDADVLQYALTLEHLENAFYKKALSMWPEAQFVAQGYSSALYNQLKYITHDEEAHVQFLTTGLTSAGAKPVAACEYSFPMTTAKEFIKLASVIEGLGTSAYLGGAPLITSKAYLTAAGSILSVEALHTSTLRGAAGEIPMANPFVAPLGLNAVYSMAANFIKSCPASNAPLPVKAYPALTLVSGMPTASGATIDLMPKTALTGTYYATYVSGLSVISTAVTTRNGMVMAPVPAGVEGQTYVFLTSAMNVADDTTILAGPVIVEATPSSPTFNLSVL